MPVKYWKMLYRRYCCVIAEPADATLNQVAVEPPELPTSNRGQ